MRRLAFALAVLWLSACSPMLVQKPLAPTTAFSGPRLEKDWVVSFDGARLGLTTWLPDKEPWAVIVALHGMDDYANAFHLPAPWWAKQGIATYAYDQRGFGRSPQRGIWAGEDLMQEDLRTVVGLVRQKYPHAVIAVVGESMGGAVAAEAFASDRPPAAERLILISPAVWGWKTQPLPYKTALWFAAKFTAGKVYEPPRWLTNRVTPTDNMSELVAMGRDKLMLFGARSDALYGIVQLMTHASDAVGKAQVPTLYLHGSKDQIIPKKAAYRAASHLKPTDRSAEYKHGYHLLTRDHDGPIVWNDIESFIRDPRADLPSGAPPIPAAPPEVPDRRIASGL